ncbi:hypothetical protein [Micromonospora sp. MP36]|uniref:hypothetical protein n=1 Tax=Micromonospora sp. MP36 TaxID=2604468 RepID=UPI0021031F5F|nr:hypothetical protein [Micromonospora sp. MP36]
MAVVLASLALARYGNARGWFDLVAAYHHIAPLRVTMTAAATAWRNSVTLAAVIDSDAAALGAFPPVRSSSVPRLALVVRCTPPISRFQVRRPDAR